MDLENELMKDRRVNAAHRFGICPNTAVGRGSKEVHPACAHKKKTSFYEHVRCMVIDGYRSDWRRRSDGVHHTYLMGPTPPSSTQMPSSRLRTDSTRSPMTYRSSGTLTIVTRSPVRRYGTVFPKPERHRHYHRRTGAPDCMKRILREQEIYFHFCKPPLGHEHLDILRPFPRSVHALH